MTNEQQQRAILSRLGYTFEETPAQAKTSMSLNTYSAIAREARRLSEVQQEKKNQETIRQTIASVNAQFARMGRAQGNGASPAAVSGRMQFALGPKRYFRGH